MQVKNFEDLEIWKDARALTKGIYQLTSDSEFSKDFGLRDQIRWAAVSIMSPKDSNGVTTSTSPTAGLRLMECCRLRVKDIDFSQNQILVRAGKGDKDRHTMLPGAIKQPLLRHLEAVKR